MCLGCCYASAFALALVPPWPADLDTRLANPDPDVAELVIFLSVPTKPGEGAVLGGEVIGPVDEDVEWPIPTVDRALANLVRNAGDPERDGVNDLGDGYHCWFLPHGAARLPLEGVE